jgi:type IV pilus assembly protein PilA
VSFTRSLIARRREQEEGFTLIELMVVVLIIAILIAIAIPTFLGARQRAQNRAVQSNLRNGLTAAKTMFTDNESYLDTSVAVTIADLTAIEPSLTFQSALSLKPKQVTVIPTATVIKLNARSNSGDCYWIQDSSTTGTSFGKTTGTCTATEPATYSPDGW